MASRPALALITLLVSVVAIWLRGNQLPAKTLFNTHEDPQVTDTPQGPDVPLPPHTLSPQAGRLCNWEEVKKNVVEGTKAKGQNSHLPLMDATPLRSSVVEKIVVRCQYKGEERNCSGKEKKIA